MCDPGKVPVRTSRDAAILLAGLMESHLEIAPLDPIALRLFIQAHWSKVAALAHVIHGAIDDGVSVTRMNAEGEVTPIPRDAVWPSSPHGTCAKFWINAYECSRCGAKQGEACRRGRDVYEASPDAPTAAANEASAFARVCQGCGANPGEVCQRWPKCEPTHHG